MTGAPVAHRPSSLAMGPRDPKLDSRPPWG